MKVTRRQFFKKSGGAAAAGLGAPTVLANTQAQPPDLAGAKKTHTICPYCAVGCGLIVHTSPEGRVIHTEGDPDHPINQGAVCAKGAGLYQMAVNENRVTHVLHRAPGASQWRRVSWDWALDRVARLVKETRDQSFIEKNDKGQRVNRTEAIAHVGSAALDNEECWTLQAMMRALGLVYIEHQARI